jgi:ketopantoate reductase
MRIAVFGTGAVGGYFGGRLAEAGEDVSFIARGKHLAAIREGGSTAPWETSGSTRPGPPTTPGRWERSTPCWSP